MQENRNDAELGLVVTSTRRDGRRRYDSQSKRRLAQACLQPGVSLAGMALKHGVNANLLRKWVVNYQRASTSAAPQAVRARCTASAKMSVNSCIFHPRRRGSGSMSGSNRGLLVFSAISDGTKS